MDAKSEARLRRADRESEVVRLRFRDGSTAEARIRDVDWDRHHTLTYLDMDHACCACTADLEAIADILPMDGTGADGRDA